MLSFFREMDGDLVLGVFNLSPTEVTVSLAEHPLVASAHDALSGDAVDLTSTADVAGVGLPRRHLRLVARAPPARRAETIRWSGAGARGTMVDAPRTREVMVCRSSTSTR